MLDGFKNANGGLLYFMAEKEFFFSALLHFEATGRCCPPLPATATVTKWDD